MFAFKFSYASKVSTKLSNFLYWGGILRLLMEGYLEIIISTMLNMVRNNREDRSWSIIFSNVFSILMTILLLVLPIFILIFYWYKREEWADEEFEAKWGAPLEGLVMHPIKAMSLDEIANLTMD